MLHYSFSTVIMTILASSAIIGLIAIVFLYKKTMVCAGQKLLAFFVGLAILRLLFPFEFPFTVNIQLPKILSFAVFNIRRSFTQILGIDISFLLLLEIVWIGGIIINILRSIPKYCYSKKFILKNGKDKTNDPKYKEPLDSICKQYKKKNSFHVYELPYAKIPFIFGISTPYIVMPDDNSIPADKLYFTLYHEALHHFHHDLLIKGFIGVFTIVYWWHPACKILQEQSNTLLEMRIDKTITQNNQNITEQYIECLLYMKKQSVEAPVLSPLRKETFLFLPHPERELMKRFLMMLQNTVVWKRIFTSIALTICVVGVYLASYLFIFEASYFPAEVEDTTFMFTPEDTYFIMIDSSHYEIYFNDIHIETVTDLASYPKGIKIYNKEGVFIDEN